MDTTKLQTNLPIKTVATPGSVSIPFGQASAQGIFGGVGKGTPMPAPERVPLSATAAPVGVQIPFQSKG